MLPFGVMEHVDLCTTLACAGKTSASYSPTAFADVLIVQLSRFIYTKPHQKPHQELRRRSPQEQSRSKGWYTFQHRGSILRLTECARHCEHAPSFTTMGLRQSKANILRPHAITTRTTTVGLFTTMDRCARSKLIRLW